MTERSAQILVAGVGNAWMQDDGFGGEVVRRLKERALPDGVTIEDFGTGGLDLAYEVMRGYDALRPDRRDRGGGAPGTLYVLEPEEAEIAAGIEDGEMIDPHAMDPQTVLRFVRAVSGWPGSVVVIACEPGRGRGAWAGPDARGRGAVPRARGPRAGDAREPAGEGAARERALTHARALAGRSGDRHGGAPCGGPALIVICAAPRASCARSSPTRWPSTSSSRARHALRGRRAGARDGRRRVSAAGDAGTSWELADAAGRRRSAARGAASADVGDRGGQRIRGRVDRG